MLDKIYETYSAADDSCTSDTDLHALGHFGSSDSWFFHHSYFVSLKRKSALANKWVAPVQHMILHNQSIV